MRGLERLSETVNERFRVANTRNRAAGAINELVTWCHEANRHWWQDPATGAPVRVNVGEKLMLVVSELAEAMEGDRKGLKDDKLPARSMLEVELADAVIRIFDLAGRLGLDLGGALVEKMAYNATRADHKPEARLAAGGKKY
jgi:NTP pyrophosphatase (non-canonical NTP hydrolase)